MFISPFYSLGANEEFPCHEAVNEAENETTFKSCTTVTSQEMKTEVDVLSPEVSSKRQCDGDKRPEDNSNICADKMTCRKTGYDEKFPRSVDCHDHYSVMPFGTMLCV